MATSIKTHAAEIVAMAATFIGLVVYIVNSTTGYMAGQGMSVPLIALSVVAVIALVFRTVCRRCWPTCY